MRVLEMEQGSPEWFEARKGIPTSSEFDKIITSTGKASAQRTKYMYKLAGQRVGGLVEEGYQSQAMLKGKEREEEARCFYELIYEPVQRVGFCLSDCGRYGSSTDGLINDKGVFELKCPEIQTHVGYLLKPNEIPTDYFCQTQGELFVTGREYVDFMSFYPGIKPLIVRAEPDKEFQKLLKKELEKFCAELEEVVKRIS
ncbi:hypothetical protein EKI60_06620 [Candidatus Saccharibacteria bacterium]|nr:MAG: hypothetical protein EKI60_06620 [Candidatus Saccharibacteria bacterium]